ncbi:MAG: tRNA pseudouridine(55) synthase TruB [Lachnospiraceae bacterium]|nr:tRNA pseudouridine(55) synthase TruB [Lachnospiraceae bacterium]
MNGILILDKAENATSFYTVRKVRALLGEKKIGHGGTLDPRATGVLPVYLGGATKLCDFLPDGDKTYEAALTLGIATDTEDIWGTVTEEAPVSVSEGDAEAAVLSFLGTYVQVPPMYSAKWVDGRRLYDLARQGIEIERPGKEVTIRGLRVLEVQLPVVRFRVTCSKGTYIRTLCKDIGRRLGLPACMSALRRVRHGPFRIEDAVTLPELAEIVSRGELDRVLRGADTLFPDYPKVILPEECDLYLLNGNRLYGGDFRADSRPPEEGPFLLYTSAGAFKAVYAHDPENGYYKPLKMFL